MSNRTIKAPPDKVGLVLSSGDTLNVNNGGIAFDTTINDGGVENVNKGGKAFLTTINTGGTENVLSGGTDTDTTINTGGTENVLSGGTARDTTIEHGGVENVNGKAVNAKINDGGVENVLSGGTAIDTRINSGGKENVENQGTANGTTINSGGLEVVSNGGTAGPTTINGGTLELARDASTGNAALTFTSSGGILQLDGDIFRGTISGFASPAGVTEEIDLRDISFGAGTAVSFTEAADHLSDTLTVTSGLEEANLTLLGQYATANFSLASDGHSGTLITDPPGSAASPVMAAHG